MNDTQIWPIEPKMYTQEVTVNHNENAEKLNGRLAMLGVIAALGAYALTGQIIPGVWWCHKEKGRTVQRKVVHLLRKNNG